MSARTPRAEVRSKFAITEGARSEKHFSLLHLEECHRPVRAEGKEQEAKAAIAERDQFFDGS